MRRWTRAGRVCTLLAALLLPGARSTDAQGVEAVGARALGMAGAFVAVADDATAVYWNPAGLATGGFFSAVVEREIADELRERGRTPGGPQSLRLQDGSSTTFALGTPPLGLAYYRLRTSGVEGEVTGGQSSVRASNLVTHNVALTLVQSLVDNLHVGTSLRLVRGSAGLAPLAGDPSGDDDLLDAAANIEGAAHTRFDVDLGVMAALGRVRVGLVGRNLRAPSFPAGSPDQPDRRFSLARQARAGVAYVPTGRSLVALDIDLTKTDGPGGARRHVAVGAEHRVIPRITLRGGVRANTIDDARVAGSIGASAALTSVIWIDAQATRGADHSDRGWGVSLRAAF